MKSNYYITIHSVSGKQSTVKFTEYNKEKIQKAFDQKAAKLKEGEELEYWKEDAKHFHPGMLVVVKKNGTLHREVTRGSKTFYKAYYPKYEASEKTDSKTYTATHSLEKVVKIHTKKIKARGGEIISKEKTKKGTVIKYKF